MNKILSIEDIKNTIIEYGKYKWYPSDLKDSKDSFIEIQTLYDPTNLQPFNKLIIYPNKIGKWNDLLIGPRYYTYPQLEEYFKK